MTIFAEVHGRCAKFAKLANEFKREEVAEEVDT